MDESEWVESKWSVVLPNRWMDRLTNDLRALSLYYSSNILTRNWLTLRMASSNKYPWYLDADRLHYNYRPWSHPCRWNTAATITQTFKIVFKWRFCYHERKDWICHKYTSFFCPFEPIHHVHYLELNLELGHEISSSPCVGSGTCIINVVS